MYGIKVRIRCITDESYPRFAEALLTDFDGMTHIFRDKLPVFTADCEPMIPGDGVIRCSVIRETAQYAEVDTTLPDDVESIMGETRFRIARCDLTENA
jgi:hypothetical protein